ncbi:AraC family transcriptional regulator [Embleya scabrispora]|uniref:AraC family transcriptional regulator n=1 Tax=Embleya scabrispora TaxID=159449 RepID=A0A1T3P1M0_9ACTN|nr:AraC family transcriptional regulator [Embleya scabrispora]OPC82978.1 AraC family transcriptional regulator [Embleya scabrispora]
MRRRNVAVLGYDGVRLMDVTAPLEVFGTAERMGGAYTVTLCSPTGEPVTTSAGTRLMVDAAAAQIDAAHTLVVPGSVEFPQYAPPLALLDAVAALAEVSERIASVCTGAFVLARAGLLDGRRAVTHWRHAALLARYHPAITVEPDAIFVRDGSVYTSAGVTAGIDLALALVEADEGADLAREVARDLVVFLRRPGGQSQFSVPSRTPPGADDPLRPVLDAVAADPAADHSLPALARLGGFSPRHLTRLFHERVGSTPAVYVEAVRIEAAQALLAAGATVTAAAARSGLGSDESLRRAFLRRLGVTPSAYRARFRSTTG